MATRIASITNRILTFTGAAMLGYAAFAWGYAPRSMDAATAQAMAPFFLAAALVGGVLLWLAVRVLPERDRDQHSWTRWTVGWLLYCVGMVLFPAGGAGILIAIVAFVVSYRLLRRQRP